MLTRFKAAYARALQDGVETFIFDGNEFVPAFARYLIQYLENRFPPDTTRDPATQSFSESDT